MRDVRLIVRVCLITVVLLAVIAGILYYLYAVQNDAAVTEGTLVRNTLGEVLSRWA